MGRLTGSTVQRTPSRLTSGRNASEVSVWAATDSEHGGADAGGRAFVRLVSDTLVRGVELSVDGADVIFSDNYFDLPAGRRVDVSFELPAGWLLPQASVRVRSVVDTYA